jgi:hypothetical protein
MNDFEPCLLPDGSRLQLVPAARGGILLVTRHHPSGKVDRLELPYPEAGFGGGRFRLSPSGRLALLAMFSGQSEEGYVLLGLERGLQQLAQQRYVFGEAASYAFSANESLLAMGLPASCVEWWRPWDASFAFGQIRIHDLASGDVSVSQLRVCAPLDWSPLRLDYDPDLRPHFRASGRLAWSMPWCEMEMALPLPDTFVVPV